MRLLRLIGSASAAGVLSLALAGSASAADDVTMNTTGPDSHNDVTISNNNSSTVTNTNDVHVVNVNVQEATTGDVSANKNTEVGGLSSGNASNDNSTSTTVTIGNEAPAAPGQGGGSGNGGNGGGGNGGAPGMGGGGSVQGAATGGMGAGSEMLPEVGASIPMDVSALRNAWKAPQSNSSAENLVKKSRAISSAMLVAAALLSLIGAAVSAVYARRQERRLS